MTDLDKLSQDFSIITTKFDLVKAKSKLSKLKKLSQANNFWQTDNPGSIMSQISELDSTIANLESIQKELTDLKEIYQFLKINPDQLLENNFAKKCQEIETQIMDIEKVTYLSGRYDSNDIIFSIHSGQGGTEAMDWTAMLYRMYTRYFDKKNYKYTVLSLNSGEEAGIKTVFLKITGQKPYGYLKGEAGVHRLVRLSPFNADNLRQTSFAKVEISPILASTDDFKLDPKDIDFSAYRSGGSGGQNVNKVSTAVRLVHRPTNISVSCQSERSQDQNRLQALEMLTSKVFDLVSQQSDKEKADASLAKDIKAGFGRQIRSYVLHPYKMVKDLRTNVETSDTDSVLAGNLDQFIEAQIRQL